MDTQTRPRRRRKNEMKVLEAIAVGHNYREAAELAGVARRTVERVMADPMARLELDEMRREIARRNAASLASAFTSALGTLEAQTQHQDPWVAQKASAVIVSIWARVREAETFEDRIAQLEERARELSVGR